MGIPVFFHSEQGAVTARTRLSPAPVMLFLSHAKADGEELAEALRNHIESTSVVIRMKAGCKRTNN